MSRLPNPVTHAANKKSIFPLGEEARNQFSEPLLQAELRALRADQGTEVSAVAPLAPNPQWWRREGLCYKEGSLSFAGVSVQELVREHGTPACFYDMRSVAARADAIRGAFQESGAKHQLYYAIKANRNPVILETLRELGFVGIDCCSPDEVERAIEHGFHPKEISLTGTNLSHKDLRRVGHLPIRINCNSVSQIRKLGELFPGREIGLRVNPRVGVGMSEQLTYAGTRVSKFGIYPDRFAEALELAKELDLKVVGVHMHVGSGWLAHGLETFGQAVERLVDFASQVEELQYVNVGGGLGVPHSADDEPICLATYARVVTERLRDGLGAQVEICCEPGDYLVNDSAIIVAEVIENEPKAGVTFLGLDVGFNSNPSVAHYGFYQEVISVEENAERAMETYRVVGNINEVIDVFAEEVVLPEVREGELLAILNCGGYGSSMGSDHCMRQRASDIIVRR